MRIFFSHDKALITRESFINAWIKKLKRNKKKELLWKIAEWFGGVKFKRRLNKEKNIYFSNQFSS